MDFQKFLQGKAFDAYEYFGAHLTEEGAVFRVYAPNAANVEVQGDFSGWKLLPMKQKQNPGVFELEIAGAECIINMRSQVRMDELFITVILMECLWNFVLDLHPGS